MESEDHAKQRKKFREVYADELVNDKLALMQQQRAGLVNTIELAKSQIEEQNILLAKAISSSDLEGLIAAEDLMSEEVKNLEQIVLDAERKINELCEKRDSILRAINTVIWRMRPDFGE